MNKEAKERYGRIEELDRSFDIEFWQAQSLAARFDAAWELVLHHAKVKGIDERRLSLDRSVETFGKQQGQIESSD